MAARELRDLVVVITGAGRGMGAEYTQAFLQEGARVAALERSWHGAKRRFAKSWTRMSWH